MRIRYKPWAHDYLLSLPFFLATIDDLNAVVNEQQLVPLVLEIGVGKGDFIVTMAQKYPAKLFIGIELNVSVLALAAQKVAAAKLKNVRLIAGDAFMLLCDFIPTSVAAIFLNHSDPWPKKRHEKRRLTAPRFLKLYEQILQKKGRLIIKTDNDDFALYSNEQLSGFNFKMIKYNNDYQNEDPFDAITEYETNFRAKGVNIKRLVVEKR